MFHDYFTVGDLARKFHQPVWKVRRAVDRINGIPRAGLYRLVPADRLGEVEQLLGGVQ